MRIRPPLLFSLLLNGVLGGILGYRAGSAPRPLEAPVVQTPHPEPSATPVIPTPEPFRWSALESEDYPTYIANLRKIGCPEPTIRDIILADVNTLYAHKRDALSAESLEPSRLPHVLAALQEEEGLLLNRLLGMPLPPAQSSALAQEQTPPSATAPEPLFTSASLPLVFAPLKADALKLDDHKQAALERLRRTFVKQIGGLNQNPNDPLYLERWQQAQTTANEQLKTLFGKELYSRYQMESLRQARK